MSESKGSRCRLPKETCLQCPYEMCIYDTVEQGRQTKKNDYILAVYDDFEFCTFRTTTESAKWLIDRVQYTKKVDTISSDIRTAIRRNKKMDSISWFRLNSSTQNFFKYAMQKSIMYVTKNDNNQWTIVSKMGESIEQISKVIYSTKEIAQVVLDTYADDNGLRLVV